MKSTDAPRVLIADDQPDVLEALRLLLKAEGYQIELVSSPVGVLNALDAREFDVVLMDLNYARDTTSGQEGLDLLSRIQALDSTLPVVVMTAWSSVKVAVEAMRRGARDFIQKPWENERLVSILRTQIELSRALRKGLRLEAENRLLRGTERPTLIAEAPAMQPVLRLVANVARQMPNVLISGEPGTGKEVVAQTLHAISSRCPKPMVTVNAGGLPEGIFESELFGHVRGAFTDAKTDRVGRFELADGSTLFLDEIANITASQQAKLAACAADGGTGARRLFADAPGGCADRLGHERRSERRSRGRPLSRGPAIPSEHDRDPSTAAARPARRHSAAGFPLSGKARPAISQATHQFRPGRHAGAARSPLAGQHPRTRSRHRACGANGAGRDGKGCRSRPAAGP